MAMGWEGSVLTYCVHLRYGFRHAFHRRLRLWDLLNLFAPKIRIEICNHNPKQPNIRTKSVLKNTTWLCFKVVISWHGLYFHDKYICVDLFPRRSNWTRKNVLNPMTSGYLNSAPDCGGPGTGSCPRVVACSCRSSTGSGIKCWDEKERPWSVVFWKHR